jgi:photosystem II stability/assembly factor-like uncharacterized protein
MFLCILLVSALALPARAQGAGGQDARAVAIDPVNSNVAYAAFFGDGFFKSMDGGLSWTAINSGLTNLNADALAIDPSTPSTVFGGTNVGLFKSTDGGNTWAGISSDPLFFFMPIFAVAVDPVNPSNVYVATSIAGIFKSTNGGITWGAINTGLTDMFVESLAIDPVNPANLYAGTRTAGLFKSTDGGATWMQILGLPSVQDFAIDPVNPARVYAAAFSGGISVSADGGGSWVSNNPAGGACCFSVAVDPFAPATVYAGSNGLGIFKSGDGGATWTAANTGLTSQIVLGLSVDPLDPARIYAATNGGVFRSTNGGISWQFVFAPAGSPPSPPGGPVALSSSLQICLGRNSPGPNFCELGNNTVNGPGAISATFGSPAISAQLTGTAAAGAGYGDLRASSSASFAISSVPGHAFSHAASTFEDLLTVSFPPADGFPGSFILRYTLNGGISTSGRGVGLATVEGIVGPPTNQRTFVHTYDSDVSRMVEVGPFPHVYGAPVPVTLRLSTDTGTIVRNGTQIVCVFCTGSGSADANFQNTLILSGFDFFDANGNPLPSPPTITSASGTQYSVDGVLESFAELSVRKIDLERLWREFEIEGSFTLGAGNNGINPVNEDIAVQLGTFSTVIPAGSFKLVRGHRAEDRDEADNRDDEHRYRSSDNSREWENGRSHKRDEGYRFAGEILGVKIEMLIQPANHGKYPFKVEAHGADLTGSVRPLTLRLMVGDDGGTTTLRSRSPEN